MLFVFGNLVAKMINRKSLLDKEFLEVWLLTEYGDGCEVRLVLLERYFVFATKCLK